MKKTLLSFMLILFTFSINGCMKREIITYPQQTVPQSVIIPTTSIDAPPPREVISNRNVITPPPSTAGNAYQLRTVQGTTIAIQERSNGFVFPQYSDKIVLLQIFGKACHYCLEEMPTIAQVQQQYGGNLQVIAVQAQDPMSQATASMLIQQHQMYYPIIDKEEAGDLLYTLQEAYGWRGILPYTLLIKDGVTEYSFSGEVSPQELNEAIRSLI
jgi:thiol-disulfide isomerase/thioredoxin